MTYRYVGPEYINYLYLNDGTRVYPETITTDAEVVTLLAQYPELRPYWRIGDVGANSGSLQIQEFPFEISPSLIEFTVTTFTVLPTDNILLFLGGTLRNQGFDKDYLILSNNIIQFQWTPAEIITGKILKITVQ
jgi:hypothetical protein